jgi:hypothetical protein
MNTITQSLLAAHKKLKNINGLPYPAAVVGVVVIAFSMALLGTVWYKNLDPIAPEAKAIGFMNPHDFKGSPQDRQAVVSYIEKYELENALSKDGVPKTQVKSRANEVLVFEALTNYPDEQTLTAAIHDSCKFSHYATGQCTYSHIFGLLLQQPESDVMYKQIIDGFLAGSVEASEHE